MDGAALCTALRAGKRVYGTLLVSPSPRSLDAVKSINLDFAFIDTEHIPLEREQLSWMCQGYKARGIAPIVRVSGHHPDEICIALDGGAEGIIVPYVETVDQVLQFVGATKFRPLKGKRLDAVLRKKSELEPPLREYIGKHNGSHILIINIESAAAMQALDEILSIPEIDAVLIGPHDLSCSLGIPEQYDHPSFVQAVDTIIAKSREKEKGVGIHITYERNRMEQELRWCRNGANLIIHAADVILFKERSEEHTSNSSH